MWVLTSVYLLLIAGFVSNRHDSQLCNEIKINIEDSLHAGFLSQSEVLRILDSRDIKYLGEPIVSVDLSGLEEVILSNQIVKKCKAYTGTNGILYIDINQREPFVRIIDGRGKGYYIDIEGNILSLSPQFTPHVLIVNGYIKTPFTVGDAVNVNSLGEGKPEKLIKGIYDLSQYIFHHELWKSQFVQIYVTKKGEIELIPRIGPHLIILGDIDDYEEKLEKLEIFYREGLNTLGWNQYVKINLKYKDQVVCTKI